MVVWKCKWMCICLSVCVYARGKKECMSIRLSGSVEVYIDMYMFEGMCIRLSECAHA